MSVRKLSADANAAAIHTVRTDHLAGGKTKSCGCLNRELFDLHKAA